MDRKPNPMEYKRPTQVLVYPVRHTEDGWRFLMLHRTPERGGFWQGVTGGAEWGEQLSQAAQRELFEETHLRPIQLWQVDCSYTYPLQDRWRPQYQPGTLKIAEYVSLAVVGEAEAVVSPEEHDDWRWCAVQEALSLLTWPENVNALHCCQGLLEDDSQPAPDGT